MSDDDHLLILEALADGVALFDRGAWGALRAAFSARQSRGDLERVPGGWIVKPQ